MQKQKQNRGALWTRLMTDQAEVEQAEQRAHVGTVPQDAQRAELEAFAARMAEQPEQRGSEPLALSELARCESAMACIEYDLAALAQRREVHMARLAEIQRHFAATTLQPGGRGVPAAKRTASAHQAAGE